MIKVRTLESLSNRNTSVHFSHVHCKTYPWSSTNKIASKCALLSFDLNAGVEDYSLIAQKENIADQGEIRPLHV